MNLAYCGSRCKPMKHMSTWEGTVCSFQIVRYTSQPHIAIVPSRSRILVGSLSGMGPYPCQITRMNRTSKAHSAQN